MEILNYTGKSVNILTPDGWVVLPPEDNVPHVHLKHDLIETVGGISIMKQRFIKVKYLPEIKTGFIYIVSKVVAMYCLDRADLVVVDDLMKHPITKQIQGCNFLSKLNLCK